MLAMRSRTRRYVAATAVAGACLCGVVLSGCASPAEVLLQVDADPLVRSAATAIRIVVSRDGTIAYENEQSISPLGPAVWPATLPIVYSDGGLEFRVEVTARRSDGSDVATMTLVSAFVPGEERQLSVRLTGSCAGMSCPGASRTCFEGLCTDACFDALPPGSAPSTPRACTSCGECQVLSPDGTCAPAPDGTDCIEGTCRASACCRGCWDSDAASCVTALSAERCGVGGDLCVACDCAGDVCDAAMGACRDAARHDLERLSTWTNLACFADGEEETFCWGSNRYGRLRRTPLPGSAPEQALVPVSIGHFGVPVVRTQYFACALRDDGALHCWGRNHEGQLGIGDTADRAAPTLVPGSWAWVGQGTAHACALDADGDLFCWGRPDNGQLGLEATPPPAAGEPCYANVVQPTRIGGGFDIVAPAVDHTLAINNGELWAWGENCYEQLGIDASPASMCDPGEMIARVRECAPRLVGSRAEGLWSFVTGGIRHSCGLRQVGSGPADLVCWGARERGQLGEGLALLEPDHVPRRVAPPEGARWNHVTAGGEHTCAIDDRRRLYCWGDSDAGEVGATASDPRHTRNECHTDTPSRLVLDPQRIETPGRWVFVEAGDDVTCGIAVGGTIWCWGLNRGGLLGEPACLDDGDPFPDSCAELLCDAKPRRICFDAP